MVTDGRTEGAVQDCEGYRCRWSQSPWTRTPEMSVAVKPIWRHNGGPWVCPARRRGCISLLLFYPSSGQVSRITTPNALLCLFFFVTLEYCIISPSGFLQLISNPVQ